MALLQDFLDTHGLTRDELPADLLAIVRATDEGDDPLGPLACSLITSESDVPLLTHDYLTDEDRANPGIMANVDAINRVAQLCTFVIQHEDGDLAGYWRGEQERPLTESPLVTYDSEGQFRRLAGGRVVEAVVSEWCFDTDQLDDVSAELRGIGVELGIDDPDAVEVVDRPDVDEWPDAVHRRFDAEERVARGLD